MVTSPEIARLRTTIAARLVEFRRAAGLTEYEIAAETGLSVSGIRKIEGPQTNPTVESLALYLRACNRSLSELFSLANGRKHGGR